MKWSIIVRGNEKTWSVDIPYDRQAEAMMEDGFDVHMTVNTIPEWAVHAGLTHVWCFFEDIWNLPSALRYKFREWKKQRNDRRSK